MGPEQLGVLIPLSAIVLGIGMGIVGVITEHRRKALQIELRHKERLVAMERGLELSPEPPDPTLDPAYRRGRALLPGLIWSFIGVALIGLIANVAEPDAAWAGGIPLAVGLGYLVYYVVEGRRLAAASAAGAPRA